MVDGDNLGVYDCEVTLDTSNIDTANITINVSKNNTTKDENVTIPSDIVSKLFPNDSSSEETTTEVVITTTTPTTFEVTTKSQAEKEAEEKKEKSTKKRNNFVSILVYTSIVLIIIIGIIFVTCKFINSNK
jgi:cobalamin biosynthesis Mg chelatase CobN